MKKLILEKKSEIKKNYRKKSYHALAGANIRRELKFKYPEVKFKVSTSSYSMGSSVRVKWFDGVTTDEVQTIINKYVYGSFDSMQDLYEYDSDHSSEYGDVKYAFTERSYTKESYEEAINETGSNVELEQSKYSGVYFIHGDYNEEIEVYKYLKEKSFRKVY